MSNGEAPPLPQFYSSAPGAELGRYTWQTIRPTESASSMLGGMGRGALTGAALGIMGGPAGMLGGAALGAAIGGFTAIVKSMTQTWFGLTTASSNLLKRFQDIDPVAARLSAQWRILDERLERAWAKTLQPMMERLGTWSLKFKENWSDISIRFFQAIEPILDILIDLLISFEPIIRVLVDILVKILYAITHPGELLTDLLGVDSTIVSIIKRAIKLGPALGPTRLLLGAGGTDKSETSTLAHLSPEPVAPPVINIFPQDSTRLAEQLNQVRDTLVAQMRQQEVGLLAQRVQGNLGIV